MKISKLTTTDAFVALDLEDAPSLGAVRCARKILQGGAKDMARSLTYSFASFGMQRGGASAGINAEADSAPEAIAAFVAELETEVGAGRQSFVPGKGVSPEALLAFAELDSRGDDGLATQLSALGPVVAAEAALGSLDGRLVAIEGFGESGAAMADAAKSRGAEVVEISMTDGSVAAEADVLLTGSKMGIINHETAAKLQVKAVVPHAPLPYTARALAVMQAAEIVVVPDFLATAGPLFAWWPPGDPEPDAIVAHATEAIATAVTEAAEHADGLFLGACYKAEAFLSTWQDTLPFGRPLAS